MKTITLLVRYGRDPSLKAMDVPAFIYGGVLGVHRVPSRRSQPSRLWQITHIPTGRAMTLGGSLRGAQTTAREILPLCDWSQVTAANCNHVVPAKALDLLREMQ